MGLRSVTLGTDWTLLGPTPLEVDTHSTFEIAVTLGTDMPSDLDCDCFRMRYDYNNNRIFDTPNVNVYARSLEPLGATVQVVPRANFAAAFAAMSQGLLTLDPSTGDVMQQEPDNG